MKRTRSLSELFLVAALLSACAAERHSVATPEQLRAAAQGQWHMAVKEGVGTPAEVTEKRLVAVTEDTVSTRTRRNQAYADHYGSTAAASWNVEWRTGGIVLLLEPAGTVKPAYEPGYPVPDREHALRLSFKNPDTVAIEHGHLIDGRLWLASDPLGTYFREVGAAADAAVTKSRHQDRMRRIYDKSTQRLVDDTELAANYPDWHAAERSASPGI